MDRSNVNIVTQYLEWGNNMSDEIKVSIIIPVYNTEKYLRQCLKSVINQTLREIEIICVDDGSTDGSPRILAEYALKDERIRVIRKENGGLVSARKAGVAAANGQYIGFVDSDDWIEPDMYANLYAWANQYQCDIVATGLFRQFQDVMVNVTNTISPGIYDEGAIQREIFPAMLYNGTYYQMGVRPNLVNKLFKRSLILKEQSEVPEVIRIGEDTAVTYACIMCAKRIFLSDCIYYHYRQHGSSMSKTKSSDKDIANLKVLYGHLKRKLCAGNFKNIMMPQINTYISNMLVQRCFELYDEEHFFSAFGGIDPSNSIAVYGAGNFGRQVYDYAVAKAVEVLWVDEKYVFYQLQGMNVKPVDMLIEEDVDYVIIAIIDETVAGTVMNNLCAKGVKRNRMRWLDIKYISSAEKLCSAGMG